MDYIFERRGGSIAMFHACRSGPESGLTDYAGPSTAANHSSIEQGSIEQAADPVITRSVAPARPRTRGPNERPRPYPEVPLYPAHLPPFPPVMRMLRLAREERERRLEKRATELLLQIEGLRTGYYVAPPGKENKRMLEHARRRFRRLRNTAMQLGFWTDGRWDAGEEETHLV